MSDPTPLIDRLMASVDTTDTCWIWTGYVMSNGYGQIKVREDVGKWRSRIVHRVAHELLIGPIPEGYHVDHLCRVRPCVNPGHLEAVTPEENARRAALAITHCPAGHAYDEENTYVWIDKEGSVNRRCRICNSEEQRRRRRLVADEGRGG